MLQRVISVLCLIAFGGLASPIVANVLPLATTGTITGVDAVVGNGFDRWTAFTSDGTIVVGQAELGSPSWFGADYGQTITVGGARVAGFALPAGPTQFSTQLQWTATFTFPEADDPNRFAESFVGVGEATIFAYRRGIGRWKTDPTLDVSAEIFVLSPGAPGRVLPYIFSYATLKSLPSQNTVPEPLSIVVWLGLLMLGGVLGAQRASSSGSN